MNSKTLTLATVLFVASILANLYFLLGNTTQLPLSNSNTGTFKLPVSIDHKGVVSQTLIYNFSGNITKATQVGNDIRLTLDISDASTPDFLVTTTTKIIKVGSSATAPASATFADFKLGSTVSFGMLYDLKNKTWQLGVVSIADSGQNLSLPPVSPTSSTSGKAPSPIGQ